MFCAPMSTCVVLSMIIFLVVIPREAWVGTTASSVVLSGDHLSTLHQLLDSLSWLVDEKVHIQQMAGASRAGYVQM